MPSPIGHALAGVATALASEHVPAAGGRKRGATRLMLACAGLAALPDADLVWDLLLPGAPGTFVHRTITHSIGATFLITIIAMGVTGWVTRKIDVRVALICGVAYGSHLLLDWFGADPNLPSGIQALWPFSHQWFISPWTIFPGTERRHIFTLAAFATNLNALAVECLVLGPIVAGLAYLRVRVKPAA